MTHLLHRISKWDANSRLSGALLALLLGGYVMTVYIGVLAAGTTMAGRLADRAYIPPWWMNAVAFGLVAAGFLPVSRWLHSHINDLIYAEHDNPYTMISQVIHHLEVMTSPATTLPVLAATIATELKLPYVAIETAGAERLLRFTFGEPPTEDSLRKLPITYLNKPVGTLLVGPRSASRPLSESDMRVLHDIVQQVGVALYAALLTADLQESRERLVIAREEERRRIRNDLHDGLAPTLSSLQLQLGAVHRLIRDDPDQAETMATEMREDLRNATAEIRRLVYDLRPPMLDELGLVGTIKNFRFEGSAIHFEVDAPDPMPSLPAAVEVAVYRIASEALHNTLKHAQATACMVCIEVDGGSLKLTVTDNGNSLPDQYSGGVGLRSMKERVAELGGTLSIHPCDDGGTQVVAQIPLDGPG